MTMQSGTLDRLSTPRTRTLSRGMSEDDSLRHIIKEAEGSARRLMRADSRTSSAKKLDKSESQSEEDLIMRLPEMLDLQVCYSDTLQELRGLELQRETLVFQVDCLQDALERAEEMLAEAQREAGDTSAELERERQTRKKLEDTVDALMQELESLRAMNQATPGVTDSTGNAVVIIEQDSSPSGLGSTQGTVESPVKRSSETTPDGAIPSSEQSANEEGSSHTPPFRDVLKQSSVDSEGSQTAVTEDHQENKQTADSAVTSESPLARFNRIVQKAFAQLPSLALDTSPPQGGIIGRPQSRAEGGMPHEEVLAETSSEWCDSVILQESFPGDAPCEAQENIPDTTPPLVQAELNEDSSSLSNPAEEQRADADSQAGPPPSPPKDHQDQQPGLDPKGLKNPEHCTLS